ncbi:uncharacterized protein L203_100710 [Cryptococcus depauperatus CBS 7841]|uniref:Uncharacterized protein n=1 Tax=Cryptococcus depauperatus CBS 7841 TaxID=1295531 RepID=A0A1E3IX77_9TREE|nr:chromatin structure-remodeling complex subunit SFH1 [Cryptococcus depauperatus CBS 7841]
MSYPIRNRGTPVPRPSGTPGMPAMSSLPAQGYQNGQASAYRAPNQEKAIISPNVRSQYRPTHVSLRAPSATAPIYHHPNSYPPGDFGFFLPPPGQKTTDPSLSTPPTTQALYTTYPSRLRTGVTGLVQPGHVTGGPKEREAFLADMEREMTSSATPGGPVRPLSGTSTPRYDSPASFPRASRQVFSGRRARVVNYVEKASDDEEYTESSSSDVGAVSDPEDNDYGARRRRGTLRESQGPLVLGGQDHQAAMRMGKLRRKMEEMDKGWTWLGSRTPGDRVRSQVTGTTKHIYTSEELLELEAERPEILVPITIDLDVPATNIDQTSIKIRDRFLWNVNEPFLTPHQFAIIFCGDVSISPNPHAQIIADLITAQIEEFQNVAEVDVCNEQVTEQDVVWEEHQVSETEETEKGQEKENGQEDEEEEVSGGEEEEEEKEDEEMRRKRLKKGKRDVAPMETRTWLEPDCRIIVNLDVQIYSHILRDRIEWDLSSPLPPTVFAKHYCTELGMSGEAIPAIAFAVTEELLKHKKDALDLELFSFTHPVEQAKWEKGAPPRTNTKFGARGLQGVWRDWWEREEYGPVLIELTMEEMERREVERTREARRMLRGLTGGKRRR